MAICFDIINCLLFCFFKRLLHQCFRKTKWVKKINQLRKKKCHKAPKNSRFKLIQKTKYHFHYLKSKDMLSAIFWEWPLIIFRAWKSKWFSNKHFTVKECKQDQWHLQNTLHMQTRDSTDRVNVSLRVHLRRCSPVTPLAVFVNSF